MDGPGGAGGVVGALALGLELVVAALLGGLHGDFLLGDALQVGVDGALAADVRLIVPAVVLVGDGSIWSAQQHPAAPEHEVPLVRVHQRAQGRPAALIVSEVHLLEPWAPEDPGRVVAKSSSRGDGVLELGLNEGHPVPCDLSQVAIHLLQGSILLAQLHDPGLGPLQHLANDRQVGWDHLLLLRVLRRPVLPGGQRQGPPGAVRGFFRPGHRGLRGPQHLPQSLLRLGALHLVVPVLGPRVLKLPLQLLHLPVALA
mmetsp:Transcript_14371/g.34874  ORF Transcript_14371/g.34874 Transcript_14371/m.34874 type:complete len:257 (-) Transcript_14371:413-1183(-)